MDMQTRLATIWMQLDELAAGLQRLQMQVWWLGAMQGTPSMAAPPGGPWTAAGIPSPEGAPSQAAEAELMVVPELCIGCGLCTRMAPATFRLDPQTGKARVVSLAGDPAFVLQMAMARCPVGAIRYRTTEG